MAEVFVTKLLVNPLLIVLKIVGVFLLDLGVAINLPNHLFIPLPLRLTEIIHSLQQLFVYFDVVLRGELLQLVGLAGLVLVVGLDVGVGGGGCLGVGWLSVMIIRPILNLHL